MNDQQPGHNQRDERGVRLTRRRLLQLGLALPVPLTVAACTSSAGPAGTAERSSPAPGSSATSSAPGTLTPTPGCDDGDQLTVANDEGPYFTPGSPERASLLEPGLGGTRLTLTGLVLSTGCRPVARALLDFWQADDQGEYDNQGSRLRGHQFTDAQGRYRLETVVPGLYPGRTRHIHVKAQPPNGAVLTTQLFFPGEPRNAGDGLFRSELLVAMRDAAGAKAARFDFVLETG
jgi:protocatechuate 3,4-dioxygenase beta subunit